MQATAARSAASAAPILVRRRAAAMMARPMVQYGFLIDHRRCIGCHACTVACKSENEVPVASFRTWVKYQEKGRFPAVKRHFAVLRCNHCTKAPCVTICPVNALSKRKDGIVDLDRDACIGCRACMQGCPYDAIYLNEDTGAAEKCHFCAHRVEQDLKPACEVVCPPGAIVSGDLHDPTSRISQMVAEHETLRRRTEQNTGPNVHYLDVEPTLLQPGRAERPSTYIWSDRPPDKPEPWPADLPLEPDTRTVLDVGHKVEWGWHVALYLLTKGVAAGAALLAPFLALLGITGFAATWLPEIAALAFTLVTTGLLIDDLARPLAFYKLLTRPNTRSWLVKGGWILTAFSALTAAILVLRWLGHAELADTLRWPNAVLGLGVAGYTAFLFRQCEGRDLWQSPLVLPHLTAQAVLCGAALFAPFAPGSSDLRVVFAVALLAHWLLMILERYKRHATENARQAAAFLDAVRVGPFRRAFQFSWGAGTAFTAAALALWAVAPGAPLAAALLALLCLYLFEAAFVRAGQLPPLS